MVRKISSSGYGWKTLSLNHSIRPPASRRAAACENARSVRGAPHAREGLPATPGTQKTGNAKSPTASGGALQRIAR